MAFREFVIIKALLVFLVPVEVTDSSEPPGKCWEANPRPLEVQPVLFSAESLLPSP